MCTVRELFSGLDTALAAQQRQDRSVSLRAFSAPKPIASDHKNAGFVYTGWL